jgi:hypothetical protein
MPRRELSHPHQVTEWLEEWGRVLKEPGEMTLIGSAALLWHAAQRGLDTPLPENSMDADPITDSEAIAELAWDAIIGSDFEKEHGWHVNLMPNAVLKNFPEGWEVRSHHAAYGNLHLIVPAPIDLLAAKAKRSEPRDIAHARWAADLGLVEAVDLE